MTFPRLDLLADTLERSSFAADVDPGEHLLVVALMLQPSLAARSKDVLGWVTYMKEDDNSGK